VSRETPLATGAGPILTKDILFGLNIFTLAGFVVMGLALTLNRMGQAGKGAAHRSDGRGDWSGFSRAVRRGWPGCGTFPARPVSLRPTRSHTAV
jgi:hypothetical protein